MADVLSKKKKWSLTQEAFDKLLASLDPDRERAGEKYEHVHSGLVRFFQWRGCPSSEDHADETINRVARKLSEGEEVRDVYTYVYGVARLLVLEVMKESARKQAALDDLPDPRPDAEEEADCEPRADCLKLCLENLPLESREMIMKYYQGEKRTKIDGRKRLAEALAVPPNVLRNRAYRLRERLQACVDDCMKKR